MTIDFVLRDLEIDYFVSIYYVVFVLLYSLVLFWFIVLFIDG